ncbi:MAG: hypothetical protein ACOYB1_12675 [Limnohabitans sp.]
MWRKTLQPAALWHALRHAAVPVMVCLLSLTAAQAQAWTASPLCHIDTAAQDRATPDSPHELEDCIEFGAAVGELGLGWRQKLPRHVRWLKRLDAATLCQQAPSEWGQKVGPPVATGCIFLAPDACTVVTQGHISPALLSHAIRHCVP